MRRKRHLRAAGLGIALIVVAATALRAHDFFLVPGAFPFASGGGIEVLAQSSSRFPVSAGAVAIARVANAVIVGADGSRKLTDMSIRDKSLVLRSRPAPDGQRIVAVDLVSRSARQSPADLLRWLRLEGAADAADRIQHSLALDGADSVTRTDYKHAKTIFEVGSSGARSFTRSSGQMIEFFPLTDPASLRAGDTLRVRLDYKGVPLAAASVHASVPAPEDTLKKAEADVHLVTDATGVVALPVRKSGLWLIRTIHVVQEKPGDWQTHWASLVFRAGR